jgi:NAD(P)-dependent dehydrogenase (short-subunit alcohol dehydrogenase family)
MRARRKDIAPLGIEGTAWDVAWAVLFLASDEARFVSGICIPVDGGATSILPLKASGYLGA